MTTTFETSSFHAHLLQSTHSIWQSILNHPFLAAVADGSIDDEVFKTWMAQDYLYVRSAVPFLGILLARAPLDLRPMLGNSIVAFNNELELFRQQATDLGVSLTEEPSPTCHAFSNFLLATAYDQPFEVGFTVLYAGEKAYLDAWKQIKSSQSTSSPYQQFIDNWTSEAFHGYVDWLAATLDELAATSSETVVRAMEEHFLTTARYEYLFWNIATSGEAWPV